MLSRRPLLALALVTAASLAVAAACDTYDPEITWLLFPAVVAFGYVVAVRPPPSWFAAAAMVLVFLPVSAWLRAALGQPITFAYTSWDGRWSLWSSFAVMPAVVAGLIGFSVRQARGYAKRLREQSAGQAVMAERLRISRELHDLVAHSVGIIALQAGAAARVLDSSPDQARAAMLAVEATGRETLSGLRRMLGPLRGADEASPLHPAPGLADVSRLAAATTAAGVRVDLRWLGEPRSVPPEVDLSSYRIIQESLTNVLRHAGAASCAVTVDYRPAELAIEVTDTGARPGGPATGRGARGATADWVHLGDPGGPAARHADEIPAHGRRAGRAEDREMAAALDRDGGGYGLVGLRERVALLRGSFNAGARAEGGFRVAVRLPTPEAG